jgi:hypothetical protein
MNVTVFNVSMTASWGLVSYGAWLQYGAGVAAMVAGGLLAVYTIGGAMVAGVRARGEVR